MALAELPLKRFLDEAVVPYEEDEVTRLIADTHDAGAFAPVAHLTVGDFRNWLLADGTDPAALAAVAPGLTPEMAAAVSKLMRNQDLILVARKCRVVTRFRNTIGLPGRLSVRLQPNHPTDDARGIAASIFDGLLYGCGDAVIGINPAGDGLAGVRAAVARARRADPAARDPDAVVRAHARDEPDPRDRERRAGGPRFPVDRAGRRRPTRASASRLRCSRRRTRLRCRSSAAPWATTSCTSRPGQGSALSAGAHHGVDQQTLEARAYGGRPRASSRCSSTRVVGFIGPEYLYDGKQIMRAGLEDHFCGKLLGVPLGVDVCYTNHAEADQDDMDTLLTLLGAAGVTYIMGVPGADDVMLNYQSTSFHDALYLRNVLGLKRAPEFEAWLEKMQLVDGDGMLLPTRADNRLLAAAISL